MQVQAIMATQGSGTTGPLMVVVNPAARACERCTKVLWDIEGCMTSAKGKAWACVPCQMVCTWALGPADVTTVTGSGTEGSGKPVPRPVTKRMQTATNASPRGGEKCKKVHTMTSVSKSS